MILLLALALAAPATQASDARLLVACAPGYPGTTAQAQPTMDDLAAGIARAAGWPEGRLEAVYHEQEDEGVERLGDPRAALALVPLAFYLKHGEALSLRPVLEVVETSGAAQVWSLVAKAGAVTEPASLQGWELAGAPGYSPGFVRRVALAGWGEPPDDLHIRSSTRLLSSLRKAAKGEAVAVLLDRAQAESLAKLPFSAELETIHRSDEMPGSLLCVREGRLSAAESDALSAALTAMNDGDEGRELLASIRVSRFVPVDAPRLEAIERAFRGGTAGPR